jgi:hypothetical protein
VAQHRRLARARFSIEELLLRHRAINAEQLARARDEQRLLGIPLVDPVKNPPAAEPLQCLPAAIAGRFKVIPVGGNPEAGLLRIATCAPDDSEAAAAIGRLTGREDLKQRLAR